MGRSPLTEKSNRTRRSDSARRLMILSPGLRGIEFELRKQGHGATLCPRKALGGGRDAG